jgi:hypothetical protein
LLVAGVEVVAEAFPSLVEEEVEGEEVEGEEAKAVAEHPSCGLKFCSNYILIIKYLIG